MHTTTNMMPHPASQIIAWCVLVTCVQGLMLNTLILAAVAVMLLALLVSRRKFLQLLRRTRWVIISLLLIYAYSTPGQGVVNAWGIFSPTIEGLSDGLLQLSRLLVALAGLSILLERLHRLQLIAGLYSLFLPLQWLGCSRERIAIRLALTLHYAEVAMLRKSKNWQMLLQDLFEQSTVTEHIVELPQYRFGWADVALVMTVLFMIGLVTLK